jgi:hypothetical protein
MHNGPKSRWRSSRSLRSQLAKPARADPQEPRVLGQHGRARSGCWTPPQKRGCITGEYDLIRTWTALVEVRFTSRHDEANAPWRSLVVSRVRGNVFRISLLVVWSRDLLFLALTSITARRRERSFETHQIPAADFCSAVAV